MLLKPGILDSPSDIALSSNGTYDSSDLHQVLELQMILGADKGHKEEQAQLWMV